MDHPHAGFIAAAYAIATIVILGAIAAVILDHRAQKRALEKLEGRTDGKKR